VKEQKDKEQIADDGRTIADMNIPGTPWYRETLDPEKEEDDFSDLDPKQLIKEAYKKFFLGVLIWVGILGVALLGIYLWLS
jgi:hypothetical protein